MKILLANYSLEKRAGSEMWVWTMHDYLSKQHDVDVYVSSYGLNRLVGKKANSEKHYDLALINHNVCLNELKNWNIGKRVFTSHGVIPQLEQPAHGADAYVAVSEEVQENVKKWGYDAEVIRNPIDTEYYSESPISPRLTKVLWMNNRAPRREMIEPATKGYDFDVVTGWQSGVREMIQWADLVVTSGRGVYEALSCGKNACIVNWCGADGIVTPENIRELRKFNCSGRMTARFVPPEGIQLELKKYDPDRNMRQYVIDNHNVAVIAGQYLAYA